jgi:methylase of polypeptide subunit release factors
MHVHILDIGRVGTGVIALRLLHEQLKYLHVHANQISCNVT